MESPTISVHESFGRVDAISAVNARIGKCPSDAYVCVFNRGVPLCLTKEDSLPTEVVQVVQLGGELHIFQPFWSE